MPERTQERANEGAAQASEPAWERAEPRKANAQAQAAEVRQSRGQLQFKRAKPEATPTGAELRVAEAGLAGGGGQLPAAEKIGASLGADLSGVRAHTGKEARGACEALGAEAYTVGGRVAFRDESPSLSLQAHEAAHTVQQGAARTLDRKAVGETVGGDRERQADEAADRVVRGEPARVEVSPAPAVQRFAPVGHEESTAEGLKGTFSAEEIGLVYQSNWERDFSQGSPKIADATIAWKGVKQSAAKSGGTPSKETADRFKAAALGVVNMSVTEVTDESLSGYRSWEHMDNPGEKAAKDADKRWGGKRGKLPGYIADAKAYIKDMLVKAVDAYREESHLGKAGDGIDNWAGAKKPEGYGAAKKVGDPTLDRAPVAEDAADRAKAAGARSEGAPSAAFAKAAEPLGRATHSLEDFFAHSNFVELAREVKTGGKASGDLKTATFDIPDKCHALGHKIHALAEGFLKDFGLLQKIFDRKEGKAGEKAKKRYKGAMSSLKTDSWTPAGEMYDILSASNDVEEAIKTGKVDLGDFLVDRAFLEALKKKGEILMEEGEKETGAGGHAKMAKDAPEPGKDYAGAMRLAREADRLVVGPLKEIMKMSDAAAAKTKLQEQLAMLDKIIAPPEAGHPLMPFLGV